MWVCLTHPLTPSLTLEKGNCGVVIPLYNFREGDRGGELREKKHLQKVPVLRSNTTKDESDTMKDEKDENVF